MLVIVQILFAVKKNAGVESEGRKILC